MVSRKVSRRRFVASTAALSAAGVAALTTVLMRLFLGFLLYGTVAEQPPATVFSPILSGISPILGACKRPAE